MTNPVDWLFSVVSWLSMRSASFDRAEAWLFIRCRPYRRLRVYADCRRARRNR